MTREEVAEERLDRLYREEHSAMLSLAYLLVGTREAAEDVVHDAFAAVSGRLDEIDNAGAYLRTVVVNGSRRWHRRVRKEEQYRTAEVSAMVADGPATADALAVRRVLRDLPSDQREAVVLRFFADLSYREIGEATGCPTQTAATRVRRGLERVAKELEDRS
jgi:RNA polymerase sigma factor (sigma-70 family)